MAAKKKKDRIDVGFNLFAYAAIGGKNLRELDKAIRKRVGGKKPYERLVGTSRDGLDAYEKALAPVSKAVGVFKDRAMQTQAETMKDLMRRVASMDAIRKVIVAKMSFRGDGSGEGKVLCHLIRGSKPKMTLLLEVGTAQKPEICVHGAVARFVAGERDIEFQLQSSKLKSELAAYGTLIRSGFRDAPITVPCIADDRVMRAAARRRRKRGPLPSAAGCEKAPASDAMPAMP